MHPPPSLFARSLEPLVSALWTFFLVWTAIVLGLWLGGAELVAHISNHGLRAAATLIVQASDPVWLVLAAANLYLHLAETEGLTQARIVASVTVIAAAGLAMSSAWTGYPLGSVAYTTRLGMKFGPVPFGWPILWFVIVVSCRCLAARILPRASHRVLAATTGALALLSDLNLEPVATKLRLYWFWYAAESHLPSAPLWRNYACWFIVAAALAWLIRERNMTAPGIQSWRPALIVVVLNGLLILGHLQAAIGG